MVNGFSAEMLTNEENQMSRLVHAISEAMKINSQTIILFGSGVLGEAYLDIIQEIDSVQEILFCDNDPRKWNTLIKGIPVINITELKKNYKDSYVIITSYHHFDEIKEQLRQIDIECLIDSSRNHILMDEICFYRDFKDYRKVIVDNLEEYKTVYNLLADEFSKKLFIDRLNYCISADTKYLTPLKSDSPQYFESNLISLSNEEIFIDGGAFAGETTVEFIKQTKGQFETVYLMEPEESKHQEILNSIADYKAARLIPSGLWDECTTLRFNGTNSLSSSINETGDTEVSVVSIDKMLDGDPVTFIKMDIEGAEMKALQGAEQSIKAFKPKLAICVYHKPLDIIDIPLFLNQLVPDYKLFLRHYNLGASETVCYAVAN